MSRDAVICTVAELADRLGEVDLLDVRWRLGEPPGQGRLRYLEGHLPGARFLDLEAVLTRAGAPTDGRHPLPEAARLTEGLAAIGVAGDRCVVVCDEPGSFAAGRAWWVLTWAGLDVRVLDGGVPAWQRAGLPLESGQVDAVRAQPELSFGHLATVDADEAAALPATGVLVDARVAERFRGDTEPIDPRAGHIPGAINLPVIDFWDEQGLLPDDATLDRLLEPVGAGPVAVYCGSGVSAAQVILAMTARGIDAALYPGSWSAWSNDPRRPAELGG